MKLTKNVIGSKYSRMKVYLATDHAGLELKNKIAVFLKEEGHDVEDCGAYEYNKDDDYPDFIGKAAAKVSEDPQNVRGIILGGSGQGEAIVANKYKGVRCGLFYSPVLPTHSIDIDGVNSSDGFEIVKLTREHNDANMLSIGFRFVKEEEVMHAIKVWLNAAGATAERHIRRIEKIKKIEESQ